jgi:hypothetical protein
MTIEEKLLVLETAIAATHADTIEKRLTIFASNLHHRGAKWRTADVLEFVLAELARQAEAHAARKSAEECGKRLHDAMVPDKKRHLK